MPQIQKSLDNSLSIFEQSLNIAGYIPLISTVSGSLRAEYGTIEVIVGVAAAALKALCSLFYSNGAERQRGLDKAYEILTTYPLHGIANIFRGIIETIPFISLATCLPYDLLGNRFEYPCEKERLLERRRFLERALA